MNNAAFEYDEVSCCVNCGRSSNPSYNPLLAFDTSDSEDVEYIHLFCAQRDSQYGFCWCCNNEKVHFTENLNEANECSMHIGESIPDYPEEDLESYIEYIQKGG